MFCIMSVGVGVCDLPETDQNPKLPTPGIGAGLADVQGNRKKLMKHYKVPGRHHLVVLFVGI